MASRCLRDLLAAAEPIRNDHGVWRCRANRRQQAAFANGLRHVVMIALEAE